MKKKITIKLYTVNLDLQNVSKWLATLPWTSINRNPWLLVAPKHCSAQALKKTEPTCFTIEGDTLDPVDSFKYLGVMMNASLSWDDHVHYIYMKVLKKLFLFRRIKIYLPMNARKLFYYTLILPLFDYCDIIWGDRGNSTLMQSLQILQNKAAKEILDRPYYSSSTDALETLQWKTLECRRKIHRCIFIHKCLNNYINHDFNIKLNKDFHNYNTRYKNNIRKTKAKRRWGHWTVVFRATEDWNSLTESIRNIAELKDFKKVLYIYLFIYFAMY